jgi:hypothetical protein
MGKKIKNNAISQKNSPIVIKKGLKIGLEKN